MAMTHKELARVAALGAIQHGEEYGVDLIADVLDRVRAKAMAEQRERDAEICEKRYAHWPNIDAALLDVSMSCGAAIRNQNQFNVRSR